MEGDLQTTEDDLLTTEDDLERFQRIVIEPNRKSLGAKCRQDLPAVLALLTEADPENLLLEIDAGICILEGYDITMEDIEIRRVEQEGYAAATISDEEIGDVSLVLDMVLDQDLLSKGLARDIIRRVQSKRKDLDLDVEATINLSVWIDGLDLSDSDWDHLQSEVRAGSASLNQGIAKGDNFEVDGVSVTFDVESQIQIAIEGPYLAGKSNSRPNNGSGSVES